MTDLHHSAAKMQSSELSYQIAYLEYMDCIAGDPDNCGNKSKELSNAYHIFTEDISTVSAVMQNKNIRNNRELDSVYIKSDDKISLGNKYRPTLHAQLFDYITFTWIATTVVILCLIFVFL